MSSGDAQRGARAFVEHWDEYWFGRASLTRLAAFRILMLVTALHAVFKYDDVVLGQGNRSVDPQGWTPIYAFELLGLGPVGGLEAHIVQLVLVASIGLGIVGLYTRTACALSAILLFHWIGTAYSLRAPHHDSVALMLGLAALPFAPVGERLSLDSAIERWRRATRGEDPRPAPEFAERAALPLHLTQVTIALGYFFSAATKLAVGGLEWANGYTLQAIMLSFRSPWTELFAQSVVVCSLLSIGTLVIQGAFPLALFVPWTRWFFLPAMVLFHLVAWKTMSTGTFVTLWFTLGSFVALEHVPSAFRRTVGGGGVARRLAWSLAWTALALLLVLVYARSMPAWILLAFVPPALAVALCLLPAKPVELWVDMECSRCRRVLAVIAALDWAARIRAREHPHDAVDRHLALVEESGRRATGRAALGRLAARLPLAVPLLPLLWLPLQLPAQHGSTARNDR